MALASLPRGVGLTEMNGADFLCFSFRFVSLLFGMPFGPGWGMIRPTQSSSNNPHIAEERQMNNVDDSGINEEDKYVPPFHLPLTRHTCPTPPLSSSSLLSCSSSYSSSSSPTQN